MLLWQLFSRNIGILHCLTGLAPETVLTSKTFAADMNLRVQMSMPFLAEDSFLLVKLIKTSTFVLKTRIFAVPYGVTTNIKVQDNCV